MNTKQLTLDFSPLPPPRPRLSSAGLTWQEVTSEATGSGFSMPVAVSTALIDCLMPALNEDGGDYHQRLWDALWLANYTLSLDHATSTRFTFSFQRKWTTGEEKEVNLHLRVVSCRQAAFVGLVEDF